MDTRQVGGGAAAFQQRLRQGQADAGLILGVSRTTLQILEDDALDGIALALDSLIGDRRFDLCPGDQTLGGADLDFTAFAVDDAALTAAVGRHFNHIAIAIAAERAGQRNTRIEIQVLGNGADAWKEKFRFFPAQGALEKQIGVVAGSLDILEGAS